MTRATCPWTKVRTLSNKHEKWYCTSCQGVTKTPKDAPRPAECKNAMLKMFRNNQEPKA